MCENTTVVTGVNFSIAVPVLAINGIATVIGVLGNALIVVTVMSHRTFYNSYYALIANLAVSDFLVCCVTLPILSGMIINHVVILTVPFTCYVATVSFYLLNLSSVMTLIAIALSRYVLVSKPRTVYDKIFGFRKVILLIGLIWFLNIVICVLIIMFLVENTPYTCGKTLCYIDIRNPYTRTTFAFGNSTSLFLCMITIPLCYILTFRAVRKSKSRVRSEQPPISATNNLSTPSASPFSAQSRPVSVSSVMTTRFFTRIRKNRKPFALSAEEIRLTKLSAVIFLSNLVLNTPFLVLNTMADIPGLYGFYLVTIWLVGISSTVNPIIYGLLNRTLRERMIKVLFKQR